LESFFEAMAKSSVGSVDAIDRTEQLGEALNWKKEISMEEGSLAMTRI
jgi:hypothetical protein